MSHSPCGDFGGRRSEPRSIQVRHSTLKRPALAPGAAQDERRCARRVAFVIGKPGSCAIHFSDASGGVL
jgi:hypothetical protein